MHTPNGFKPGQEILVSVYGGTLLGRVAFTQGPWVNFTVISVVEQTAQDISSYAAGDARTVDHRQVSLSDTEQMKQGRLLTPHAEYRLGQGRQVWTAGQQLPDGRQFIESDPASAKGQGRWQAPRRKLVTPELAARLSLLYSPPAAHTAEEQPAEPEAAVMAAAAEISTDDVLAAAAALTPDAAAEHYENYLRYRAAQQAKQQPFTASQQDAPLQYLFYAQYPKTPAAGTQPEEQQSMMRETLALQICRQFGRNPHDPESWAECLWDADNQLAAAKAAEEQQP